MNRVEIIQKFINFIEAKTYLEIGVRHGETFFAVQCKNKIGVDVEFPFDIKDRPETFYAMTSDEYFSTSPSGFDIAFIDGDHTYEQSLRDAENCLKYLNPNGIVLLHDCNPKSEEWASPVLVEGHPDWSGEVWKTIVTLRTNPKLSVFVLNEDCGIGIVRKDSQLAPLAFSKEQIAKMTYKDLDENRELFLNLL